MTTFALAVIFVIIVFISRTFSAFRYFDNFIDTLKPIFNKPFATYDEKMSMQFPVFYDFANVINLIVPENGNIYLPDQDISYGETMWPISRSQMCSAIFYPRNVLQYDQNSINSIKKGSYIVVTHGLPNVGMEAEKIYKVDGRSVFISEEDYNPKDFGQDDNGLIKL